MGLDTGQVSRRWTHNATAEDRCTVSEKKGTEQGIGFASSDICSHFH
jgi:hypothetical protein